MGRSPGIEGLKLKQDREIRGFLNSQYSLLIRKGTDYSGEDTLDSFRTLEDIGISPSLTIFMRLADKFQRIKRYMKKKKFEVSDESVEDTLLDLANYSVLLHLALKEEGKKYERLY